MVEILLGIYGFIVWLIFWKFELLPRNGFTMAWVILGGILMIAGLFMGIEVTNPTSKNAQFYTYTTSIVPNVKGQVTDVYIERQQPLKAGDPIFKIDDTPYVAEVEKLEGDLVFLRDRLEKTEKMLENGAGSVFDLQEYKNKLSTVKARLKKARFELANCVYRAPTDGYVSQLSLRPGQMAVPFPFSSAGVFVHSDRKVFVAAFKQRFMPRLIPGEEVELAFDAIPGYIVKGKVKQIAKDMGNGQLKAGASMMSFKEYAAKGSLPVIIELDDKSLTDSLPAGSRAETVAYSGQWKFAQIIKRIMIRMNAWANYLPFELPGH